MKKNEFIELYRQCFDDSEAFIDYFFREAYDRADKFFEQADDRLCAAVYLVPKRLRYFSEIFDMPFITALATEKNHRRQGFAERVMRKALTSAQTGGAPFIALSPVDESYYLKYGFTGVEYERDYIIKGGNIGKIIASPCADGAGFEAVYAELAEKFDIALDKKGSDFRAEKYGADEAYLLKNEAGKAVGFVFFDGDASELIVPPDLSAEFFEAVGGFEGKTIKPACKKGEGVCKTMVRALDLETALSAAPLSKDLSATLYVRDAFLGDSALKIENGRAKHFWREAEGGAHPVCDFEIGIAELSALLFGVETEGELSRFFGKGSVFICDRY